MARQEAEDAEDETEGASREPKTLKKMQVKYLNIHEGDRMDAETFVIPFRQKDGGGWEIKGPDGEWFNYATAGRWRDIRNLGKKEFDALWGGNPDDYRNKEFVDKGGE